MRSSKNNAGRKNNMNTRMLFFAALAGISWSSPVVAQATCPNGAPASAAGICPVFVQGDPSCVDAAQICGINVAQQVVFSPPGGSNSGVVTKVVGTAVDVQDVFSSDDQQLG